MKKMIMLVVATVSMLMVTSCGPALKRDGSFSEEAENFVGKFRDVSIYSIQTPNGTILYFGVREDGSVTGVSTAGKYPVHTIIIDDVPVTVEQAKEILKD